MLDAAHATRDAGATQFCIVVAVRGPDGAHAHARSSTRSTRSTSETGLEVACSLGLLTEEQAQRLAAAGVKRYNHNLEASASAVPVDRVRPTPTTTASPPPGSRSTRAWSCAAAGSSAWARRSSSASTSRSSSPSSNRARCRSTSSTPDRARPLGDERLHHAARGAAGHRAVPPRAAGRVAPPRRWSRVRARRAPGDGPARRRQRADRGQLPHVDRPSAPKRTTRCSRRSGMPVADGPGEGRFVVDAAGAHARPAQPHARRHPRPRRVAPLTTSGRRRLAAGRCAGTPRGVRAGRGRTGRRATQHTKRPTTSSTSTTHHVGQQRVVRERRCRGTATRTARSLVNAPDRMSPQNTPIGRHSQPAAQRGAAARSCRPSRRRAARRRTAACSRRRGTRTRGRRSAAAANRARSGGSRCPLLRKIVATPNDREPDVPEEHRPQGRSSAAFTSASASVFCSRRTCARSTSS